MLSRNAEKLIFRSRAVAIQRTHFAALRDAMKGIKRPAG